MKPSEATVLLATIARTDQRTVSESSARSWAELMTEADVPLNDAIEASKYHFGHSPDYLMPIHIINRVKEVRQERLSRAGTPPIPGDLTWNQERSWRRLWCANVKDGMSVEEAAAAASEAMSLPKELPPAPDAVADERKALVQKLADSKAAPKPRPEDHKPIERKPRERWGCWWRGGWGHNEAGDDVAVFRADGDRLFYEGGPWGVDISALSSDMQFWLDHIGGKAWGTRDVLRELVHAWADICYTRMEIRDHWLTAVADVTGEGAPYEAAALLDPSIPGHPATNQTEQQQ